MVKNRKLLAKFEHEQRKRNKLSYTQALKIYESMWKEAKELGIFPLKDPMEGIEVDIKIAKILNSCLKSL
ncbi:MAG: hypothetical protein HY769_05900 [Candidatus Stahlbacteria bacterium]|nr:hypothetical protein [Candidatus Stahlbacteria bacterium]